MNRAAEPNFNELTTYMVANPLKFAGRGRGAR